MNELMSGQEKIAKILLESLPRELLLNFERLYPPALERALQIGLASHKGHRASVTGTNRHFGLNEALLLSFDESGIPHTPLRGNSILVGKVGIAAVARVHMNSGKWDNSRRSKAKVKLCAPNKSVSSLVQIDWIRQQSPEASESVEAITVFLVTEGDGTQFSPCQIYIVVPDQTMDLRSPMFSEPLSTFLQRYHQVQDVLDTAKPKLKASVATQPKSGDT